VIARPAEVTSTRLPDEAESATDVRGATDRSPAVRRPGYSLHGGELDQVAAGVVEDGGDHRHHVGHVLDEPNRIATDRSTKAGRRRTVTRGTGTERPGARGNSSYAGLVRMRPTVSWTPTVSAPRTTDLAEVVRVVGGRGVVVLSGAGLSTESGIPDYRGAGGTLRRHSPMTYQEFVGSEAARQRYWARSHVGWPVVAQARPNVGHRAVAALQRDGYVFGVITQNVDGLHQAAGATAVIELHGSLSRVVCLECGQLSSRRFLDRRLREANPTFRAEATRLNPDGDVDLPEGVVREFRTVSCHACGTGVLKPDVVFFGENVPRPRVEECYRLVDDAKALLVLGSSLAVMSGLRFVRHAAKAGKPVLIVNKGETRGDPHALVRVDRTLGPALAELADRLGCPLSEPAGNGSRIQRAVRG
jgi:NAD-dependent SIR2 family protein deacetylase